MSLGEDGRYISIIIIEVEMQTMSAHCFIKAGQVQSEQDGTKLNTLRDAPGKRSTGVDMQLFILLFILLLTLQSLLTASALVSIER